MSDGGDAHAPAPPPPPAPAAAAAPSAGRVESYAIKILPYWASDPQIWFAQVEAQFGARGITVQKTMYQHVVSSLSPEIATEVRDILLKPPETPPYDVLKKMLIERTSVSEQRRLQQLFTAEELGDRKPTQLLRRMQQLLGDKETTTDSSFIKELFMQRLPTNIRIVLASASEKNTLQDLATLADKMMEVAGPTISTVVTPTQATSEGDSMRAEISSLREQVSALQAAVRPRRSRSRSQNRGRPRSPSGSGVCWYHRRFGDSARKCTPPCTKSGNIRASN